MRKRPGFTRMDLLVVISIIALLMAILRPSLSRAEGQARATSGGSNLRQYRIGLRMCPDDNSYEFPEAETWLKSESHNEVRKGRRDNRAEAERRG